MCVWATAIKKWAGCFQAGRENTSDMFEMVGHEQPATQPTLNMWNNSLKVTMFEMVGHKQHATQPTLNMWNDSLRKITDGHLKILLAIPKCDSHNFACQVEDKEGCLKGGVKGFDCKIEKEH